MSAMKTQPGYNDIVITNFVAAANPNAEGSYSVFFESAKNKGELRIVEVTESGAKAPQVIPDCDNFSDSQRICATYFGEEDDIALFYIGGQSQGELYLKVRAKGTWGKEKELKEDKRTNLLVGQDSYISCTASGGKLNLYYTQGNSILSVATGPDEADFWEREDLRCGKGIKGKISGPMVVTRGPHDTLLVYSDPKGGLQVLCQTNGAGAEDWTRLVGITDAAAGTPLAANLESYGATAGVFNVFYHKDEDQTSTVFVARRSKEPFKDDASAFSTTDSESSFAAVTLNYHCNCCTGCCKCSRPAQRFLAVSKRDSHSTLFQYHRTGTGRWVIPNGLIITNEKFYK